MKHAVLAAGVLLLAGGCSEDEKVPEGGGDPDTLESIAIKITEVTKNTVSVEYTPSTDKLTYYGSIIDKAYFDEFATDDEYIQDDLDYFKHLAQEGQTAADVIAELTVKGKRTLPFKSLEPNTQYVAYAFGVNTDGKVTSVLFKEPFSTPQPADSDNKLTLDVTKVGPDGATVSATATNEDPYILDVWETSKLEGKSDPQIIEALLATYDADELAAITENGSQSLDLAGRLDANTAYTAIAFGYEAGITTTSLVKQSFTTKPGGWTDCTFPFTKETLNCRLATYKAIPTDQTIPYFFTLATADQLAQAGNSDEAVIACITDKLREEAKVWGMTYEQALPYLLFRGEKSETYTELTPETDYYLCAVGINLKGEIITDAVREKITTPAVSAATVSFGQPSIDDLTVTVSVKGGSGTPKWKAVSMFAYYPSYTDGYLISHLLTNVKTENPETLSMQVSEKGQSAYFFAVGLDSNGNPGELVKLEVPVN